MLGKNILLFTLMLSACAETKNFRSRTGSGDQTPITRKTLSLNIVNEVNLEKVKELALPSTFEQACFASSSRFSPTMFSGDKLGIRYARPETLVPSLTVAQQNPILIKQGWYVQVYPNSGGAALPDFSKLTPNSTNSLVGERPDFDGATGPGGLRTNFAVKSDTTFRMPVTRTVQFQLRSRGPAKLLIDDKVVLESNGTGNNPAAVTASVNVAAGFHSASLQYAAPLAQNPGALISLMYRLETTTQYSVATYSGALPFQLEFADEEAAKKLEDTTRTLYWPNIPGAYFISACQFGTSYSNGLLVSKPISDLTGVLGLKELVSDHVDLALNEEPAIDQIFPVADQARIVQAAILTKNSLIFRFNNGQNVKFSLAQFDSGASSYEFSLASLNEYPDNLNPEVDVHLLRTQNNLSTLLRVTLNITSGEVQTSLVKLVDQKVERLGQLSSFALFKTDDSFLITNTFNNQIYSVNFPGQLVWQGFFGGVVLGQTNSGDFIGIDAMDILQLDTSKTSVNAKSLKIADNKVASSTKTWIDGVGQIWFLNEDKTLSIYGRQSFIHYYSPEARFYVEKANALQSIDFVGSTAKSLGQIAGGQNIGIRDKVLSFDANNEYFVAQLNFAGNEKIDIPLTRSFALGTVTDPDPIGSNKPQPTPLPTTGPGPTPPPSTGPAVSFAQNVKPFIDRSCAGAGCHSRPNAINGVALETKDDIQTRVDRIILIAGPAGTMPLGNRPRLSAAELKTLADWKAGGFKD